MKPLATSQKLRGGYYTPKVITDFLVRWAVQRRSDAVLEPSCGDGAFLESLRERREELGARYEDGKVVAVELDAKEAAKAESKLSGVLHHVEIRVGDFFKYCQERLLPGGLWDAAAPRFDVVIGNPPFIRYQSFPDEHRNAAFELLQRCGLHPNRLTNTWVPFLVCGSLALSSEGRLAMVIPAELLQVNYAAEVRRFLARFFERITLVTFRSLVFPQIQQEVVLLLAEKRAAESRGIRTVELRGADALTEFDFFQSLNADTKELDHTSEKWTKYFLPSCDIALLRHLRQLSTVSRLSDVAEVDVGVVTGENSYFLLRQSEVRALRLASATTRVVSRSSQLTGLSLRRSDWNKLVAEDARVHLFLPSSSKRSRIADPVARYITHGEERGFHTGYKCRIRNPWFIVPSVWAPDAFALRQIHRFPKLVVNRVGATSTDTVHRVRFLSGVNGAIVAAAFLNSMTFAFAEVMGRSYGGGVLTFEPSEVEALPLSLGGAEELDRKFIDKLLRAGDIYAVLDHTDEILLRRNLGLERREVALLRSAWERLRDRRMTRRGGTRQLDLSEGMTSATTEIALSSDRAFVAAAGG